MKVFIAALAHETNSFSPIPTNRASFEAGILFDPLLRSATDAERAFVGYSDFVRLARERGYDTHLSIAAWAQPSAPTNRADYEDLRDRILKDLRAALPVDMVLFMLHGAQMAHGYDDCEGDLIERARATIGENVPIGVELDLHCNITRRMLAYATILIACKEYPHIDFPERARELFDIVEATARCAVHPVVAARRVPMLARFHTTAPPMRAFVDHVKSLEGRDGVLSITLGHGFPWSDAPDTSASVVVYADGAPQKANALADELAREFFLHRGNVYDKLCSPEQALNRAIGGVRRAQRSGPVVIADVADNAGGGAAGDSTFLLQAVISRGDHVRVALGMIWDPIAVQAARAAGVGTTLPLRIGGKMGPASGTPIDVVVTVTALADDPVQRGLDPLVPERLGACAALRVGCIDIVINSARQQVFSPDCFTVLGIDPATRDIVIVKSSQHFHAQFAPLAEDIIYCDPPGLLNSNLAALPYTRLRRPIWPIDALESVELAEPIV